MLILTHDMRQMVHMSQLHTCHIQHTLQCLSHFNKNSLDFLTGTHDSHRLKSAVPKRTNWQERTKQTVPHMFINKTNLIVNGPVPRPWSNLAFFWLHIVVGLNEIEVGTNVNKELLRVTKGCIHLNTIHQMVSTQKEYIPDLITNHWPHKW